MSFSCYYVMFENCKLVWYTWLCLKLNELDPSEHETHSKRFSFASKRFSIFEAHLKCIWNAYLETVRLGSNEGILDAHVMRIQNALRYAHPFRVLNAHCIRISDAYLMRISIASMYFKIRFYKSIIEALIRCFWNALICAFF